MSSVGAPMARCAKCDELLDEEVRLCWACGTLLGIEPADMIDGRYVVLREVGRGSMGRVLLAADASLGRRVAIKLVSADVAPLPEEVARFRKEAAALGRVRSPHVVQVYSFGFHGKQPYLVMEFVEGSSVEDAVGEYRARGKKLPLLRVSTIVDRVAAALADVHAAGLTHCDVKPGNILLEAGTGRPVLVDFGLVIAKSQEQGPLIRGTPAYISPEQVLVRADRPIGPASDQYSLACTAFELLTGRPPFMATSMEKLFVMQVQTQPPLLSAFDPRLRPLDAVVARALDKDPAARFRSASEFGGAFVEAALRIAGASTASGRYSAVSLRPPTTPAPRVGSRSEERPVPNSGVTIVVLDEDPASRRIVHRAAQLGLFRSAVRVASYGSGEQFLAEHATAPALLVVHDRLADIADVDLISTIRSMPGGERTRVIVIGNETKEQRWRFAGLGIEAFVARPLDFALMVDVIGGIAEKAGWRVRAIEESAS